MTTLLNYIGIPLLLIVIFFIFKYRKVNITDKVIKQPKFYYINGVTVAIIGLILASLIFLVKSSEDELMIKLLMGIGSLIIVGFGLFLIAFYHISQLEFTETYFVVTNALGKQKRYLLKDLSYDQHLAKIDIYHQEKLLFNISPFLVNYQIFSKYIKPAVYNKDSTGVIKGNSYTRNFGFIFLIIGLVCLLLAIFGLVYFNEHSADIAVLVFITILGLLCFSVGVMFLLFRFVWRINVNNEDIIVRNIFGISYKYKKEDLTYSKTNHGYKIYVKTTNKTIYFNENFTEHPKLIYSLSSDKK